MSAAAASGVRARLGQFFRNRRVRTVIFVLGGYKLYTSIRTYNTLFKTFSAHHHRPGETILDLDLDAVHVVTKETISAFSSAEEIRLQRLINTLEDAKADPRVTGLVVRGLGGLRGIGLAEICELRDVIKDFSKGWGGKQTMLHVPEGLGGAGNGTVPLYFASGFDSVHVQPTSAVITPGLSAATLFFKKLLEHVGVKAKKVARKEFKTAANTFTEEKFTEPHKESTEALLNAIMSDIVKGVAEGRNISEERVKEAIDTAVMCAKEAEEFGIVDEALYRDQLPKVMRTKLKEAAEARAKTRTEAVSEWRRAMDDLKQVWVADGVGEEIWADGDILQNLAEFETAIPVAMTFADERQEWVKKTNKAEIRALKAHIQWLETCPWEGVEPRDTKHSPFFRTSNISSMLELEKRICEDAIVSLEECPKLLESFRKEAEDDNVLQLNEKSSLSLIRWCRGMWRAKCMAARIVGTLRDSDEELKRMLKANPPDALETKLEDLAKGPRVFLLGLSDDLRHAALADSHEDKAVQESILTEKLSAERTAEGVKIESRTDVQNKDVAERGLKLKHVRFSDYMDLLNSEKRAVLERSGGAFIRFESADPFQKLPGTIDSHERQALLRLQLAGHRFSPWRLSIPRGDIIAVISIQGPITDDQADTTRAAIRRADKDPHVKGIVLRVESPGGSATASDLISRAVEVAKKPVVASMGSVCASGGYFISAPCDKVLASNMTVTGSIGVIFSAFNTAGLFEKLGITTDSVESGRFSKYFGAQGSITEWSDEFATRIDSLIDNFYDDFVNVVAKGRHMDYERAERIARGRVWAGSDALSLGLVDEIGGLREAVQAAAELAHMAPDAKARAVDYPTVAMQVADAARRRGLMPSHLDEEGDEAAPEARRRRWFRSKREDPANPDSPTSPNEPQSALDAFTTRLSWDYEHVSQSILNSAFQYLDRFILMSSTPSTVVELVENGLSRLLGIVHRDRASAIISEEIQRTRATAGRAAAIAPHVRVDE